MKRSDESESNQDNPDHEFSIQDMPLPNGADQASINLALNLRQALFQRLSPLPVEEIIDLILEVLPKAKPIYESMMTKRRLEEINDDSPAVKRPTRAKEDKIMDILNRLDLLQLHVLEAELLEHERPHRGYK